MNNRQSSTIFWIIFLVIVAGIIVIIFPKYGRLSKQLDVTQSRNIAAQLTASSAANYTQRKANATMGVAINNCKDVINIEGNRLPPDFQINSQEIPPDKVAICTLQDGTRSIQFSVVGIN